MVLYLTWVALALWTVLTNMFDFLINENDIIHSIGLLSYYIVSTFACVYAFSVFVLFLCQTTKHYYKMRIMINKMFIMNEFARNNDLLWKALWHVKHGITVHSMKGELMHYQLYWARIFRLTIVFTVTKLLLYLLSVDINQTVQ